MGLKHIHHKKGGHLPVIDHKKEQVSAEDEVENTTLNRKNSIK
jgi:hypothetical protein